MADLILNINTLKRQNYFGGNLNYSYIFKLLKKFFCFNSTKGSKVRDPLFFFENL